MTQPMALEQLEWQAEANGLVQRWASDGRRFTADDLRAALPPAPHPNAVGPVFQAAARRGLIEKVSGQCSTVKSRNGGHQYTWVGNPDYRAVAA